MSKNEKDEASGKNLPAYQDVGFFNLAAAFSVEAFQSALKYKPRSDDIFVVTYPKCGTIWVKTIVSCICRNGKPFTSAFDFFKNAPFLELLGAEAAEAMERPGPIMLHLPFHLTPYSPKAKYIFVARNPKDCCVSFYHHTKNHSLYRFENGTFDNFFELFISGKVDFGDYFDTLLSWYEHRNDPNVLFLTFEEIKNNNEGSILKIAEFMGEKYKDAMESSPQLLKDVIHYSSFDYMKKHINKYSQEILNIPTELIDNIEEIPQSLKHLLLHKKDSSISSGSKGSEPVRKGTVGDWRSHFSDEQNRRMEAKFYERTKETDIPKLWKGEMGCSLE